MGSSVSVVQSINDEQLLEETRKFLLQDQVSFDKVLKSMCSVKAESISNKTIQSTEPHPVIPSFDSSSGDGDPGNFIFDGSKVTGVSTEIANEITLMRSNPRDYTKYLKELLARFVTDTAYSLDDPRVRYMTTEGKSAVIEAIEALNQTSPLGKINPSSLLEKAAIDHCKDMEKTKDLRGHTGSDGSEARQRISRYGKYEVICGECIDYGMQTARNIIIHLLIDDGVSDRGHRINLLERQYTIVGAAYGPHTIYTTCCVMDFAGGILEFNDIINHDMTCECNNINDIENNTNIIKIINTIVGKGEQKNEIIKNCIERLANNTSIKIMFKYKHTDKKCEIEYIGTNGTEIATYSWS
jgi:uncharacterized protein YkwD